MRLDGPERGSACAAGIALSMIKSARHGLSHVPSQSYNQADKAITGVRLEEKATGEHMK